MDIEAPDSIDTGIAYNVIEDSTPQSHSFQSRMMNYTISSINEIAYRLQVTTESDLEEMNLFSQIVDEFRKSCSSLFQSVEIPDSNEKLLNQQHQLQVDGDYLGKKFKHLQSIRDGYSKEKKAWEDNLAFFKNPISLTSIDSVECVFEGINDTATLSRIYDDSGILLSILRKVEDARDEVVYARKQLMEAYQKDVLDRWNANDMNLNTIQRDLDSARQSMA